MADFLATRLHINMRIEDTISHAKEYIYLLTSDFAHLPQPLFQKLWEASSRGVKVFIIYANTSLTEDQLPTLQKFRNLSLYSNPGLRYNTTFNEHEAVIHSISTTSHIAEDEIHSGVHFKKKYASEMHEKLLGETKEIRNNGTKMTVNGGQLVDYLKLQETFVKAEEEKKINLPPPTSTDAPVYGSKKLTVKEKQKLILDTFAEQCPDCQVKIEDAERVRVQGKGIVVFTNKEKIEIIFVRYDTFNAKKEEFKEHVLRLHPGLPIWCTYNRITLHADKADEIITLFASIKNGLALFGLV
jgi:hypothetical protein